jgi:hypothetical protein
VLSPVLTVPKLLVATPETDSLNVAVHCTLERLLGLLFARVMVTVGAVVSLVIPAEFVVEEEVLPARSVAVAVAVTAPSAREDALMPVSVTVPLPFLPATVAGFVETAPTLSTTEIVSVVTEVEPTPTLTLTADLLELLR